MIPDTPWYTQSGQTPSTFSSSWHISQVSKDEIRDNEMRPHGSTVRNLTSRSEAKGRGYNFVEASRKGIEDRKMQKSRVKRDLEIKLTKIETPILAPLIGSCNIITVLLGSDKGIGWGPRRTRHSIKFSSKLSDSHGRSSDGGPNVQISFCCCSTLTNLGREAKDAKLFFHQLKGCMDVTNNQLRAGANVCNF